MDPVNDVDKIKRLEGFKKLLDAMYNETHKESFIHSTNETYAVKDEDLKNICLYKLSKDVACWRTETL